MKTFIAASLFFISLTSYAVQEIEVVVADQSFSSSNKVVIGEKEIKDSHINSLPTLISAEANVTTSTSNFTPSSIFIRGGDSSHVLFVVDGIPTYDASTLQRTINMNSLNLRTIKKIEIIKGPQVVLYGGQALSAVIKIETFPTELKNSTDVAIQGGERYADGSFSQQFKLDDAQALSASLKYTDHSADSPVQDSKKTYPQRVGNVGLTYVNRFDPAEKFETLVKAEYSDDQSQMSTTDDFTGKAKDTENFDSTTTTMNLSAVVRETDKYSLSLTHQQSKRSFEQEAAFNSSLLFPGATDEDYEGELQSARLDINLLASERVRIDSGLSFTNEEIQYLSGGILEADEYRQYEGLFVKGAFKLGDDFLFEPGYRKEAGKLTSLADTYQAGLSYKENIKLEFAKAFKTPSLFQLYGYSGNPNLKPERVSTTSLSFEGHLTDSVRNSLTFFRADYKDLLATRGNPRVFQNVGKASIRGAEYFVSYNSNEGTHIQTSIGYQEPKDVTANNWLLKRPLRTASLKVNQNIAGDKASAGVEVVHTGSRREIIVTSVGAPTYTTLNDYTLVHLVGQYAVQDNLDVFARAENIFSQEYQPSYGYYVDGPVVRAGLNYNLD